MKSLDLVCEGDKVDIFVGYSFFKSSIGRDFYAWLKKKQCIFVL